MERFSSLCSHQIQRQVKSNKKTRGINIAAASHVYADADVPYFSKNKKKNKDPPLSLVESYLTAAAWIYHKSMRNTYAAKPRLILL